jgi:hypothetical protein
MIEKLKDGCATAVTILQAGVEFTFRLVLASRDNAFFGEDRREYFYAFYNEQLNMYFNGCYSGGVTGCGVSDLTDLDCTSRPIKIEFTELKDINAKIDELLAQAEEADKAREALTDRKVAAVNAMPKSFPFKVGSMSFSIERSTLCKVPTMSRFLPGLSVCLVEEAGVVERVLYPERYYTADGKYRRAEVRKLLGEEWVPVMEILAKELKSVKLAINAVVTTTV